MSRIVRKPAFCICENKDPDQLCGNREADQHLCFRFIDCTIPLLPKSKISSLYPSSMAVQSGLCGTRSKTLKTIFSQRGSNINRYLSTKAFLFQAVILDVVLYKS